MPCRETHCFPYDPFLFIQETNGSIGRSLPFIQGTNGSIGRSLPFYFCILFFVVEIENL